jgi:hypothetical protein
MKAKMLGAVLALAVALAVPLAAVPSVASAAPTNTMNVTYTAGSASVIVYNTATPTQQATWNQGNVVPEGVYTSAATEFTVENLGSMQVDTKIVGVDAVGNDGHTWTLTDDGTNTGGDNRYGEEWTVNGVTYNAIPKTDPGAKNFVTLKKHGHPGGQDKKTFGLRMTAPSNDDCMSPGEVFTTTITISVVAA